MKTCAYFYLKKCQIKWCVISILPHNAPFEFLWDKWLAHSFHFAYCIFSKNIFHHIWLLFPLCLLLCIHYWALNEGVWWRPPSFPKPHILCSGEDVGEFGGGEMSAQNILFENNSFEYKNHTNAGEGKMLL